MKPILVVDDEMDVLKLVTENLLIRGFEVSEAHNAQDALAKLYEDLPSLMILDIKLPDFSGWELLQRINADPLIENHFPVLVMTASITEANFDGMIYPNVVEVLIKPFSTNNLMSIVKRTLNHC